MPASARSCRYPCRAHRAKDDDEEREAAEDRDQASESHEAHAGNLTGATQHLFAARKLALHAVTAGPHQAGDVHQLPRAVERGLERGEAPDRRAKPESGQEVVDDAHQRERHTDDAAVVMRGDLDVVAVDEYADHA